MRAQRSAEESQEEAVQERGRQAAPSRVRGQRSWLQRTRGHLNIAQIMRPPQAADSRGAGGHDRAWTPAAGDPGAHNPCVMFGCPLKPRPGDGGLQCRSRAGWVAAWTSLSLWIETWV